MNKKQIYLGDTKVKNESVEILGKVVDLEGENYYEISNYDHMQEFFMTIVSDSDHWMFISSNGSLSAGRKNRDNALFPYYTVDKIHDYKGITGSRTLCLLDKNNRTYLWEPFVDDHKRIYNITRKIYKSVYGNKIIFEEHNSDLEVSFQYAWCNSEIFGWIRKAKIENKGNTGIGIEVIDGISNILPYGIDYDFQNEYSNLLDAYKRNELLPESRLGLFTLSSIPVDKAEPSEALKATTVWSLCPVQGSKILISDNQLENFRLGRDIETETDIKARRGSYFVNIADRLDPNVPLNWHLIAEINQDAADVADLNHLIREEKDLALKIEEDIAQGTLNLKKIIGGADGIQAGEDKLVLARHFSNTLFNSMRGGLFTDNYLIDTADFRLFVKQCNKAVYDSFVEELKKLPLSIEYKSLILWSSKLKNPDLERICYEYLPLTFSRRHGDPSRPWNLFSIETKNEDGSRRLNYEGNWRDIFQNWEALSLSFPAYIESIISKFVNASTADGYNPYRIGRDGIDWESPDPDDSWSYIGYWNDHQIIYLQKFLEQSENFHPGKLDEMLQKEIFVYANVPYRIKSFEEIVAKPKDTIVFDYKLNDHIGQIVGELGSDGRLLQGPGGEIYRVTLLEKILSATLAKLSNFIPGAGLWLNTQRPEWNDANNALVGNGTSMVTLYYLRRFLHFWKEKFVKSEIGSFKASRELITMFKEIFSILSKNTGLLEKGYSDRDRYSLASYLGKAGSRYRQAIYTSSFSGKKDLIDTSDLVSFIDVSLLYIDHTIKLNRRDDGLYHAYNLISINSESISIRHLYEMLEGQVAVLSSGFLSASEGLGVLDAMKASNLYREDQYSYLLYPERELAGFTQKNIIPENKFSNSELLQKLVQDNNRSILGGDTLGYYHFNGNFRNAQDLSAALDKLATGKYHDLLEKERDLVLEIFESVFDHQSFTGRSGTFYGYEGLGSIYWHMVSKLLLATQECYKCGEREGEDPVVRGRLKDHYYEIKAGIGLYKSPALYGAFPTDAYSHTPANSGAKQPGLTGQVKEDIISRFGEFGVHIDKGRIAFNPSLLNHNEVLKEADTFKYIDINGLENKIALEKNQLAFTYCQVPVVYTLGSEKKIRIELDDGSAIVQAGSALDLDISQAIFSRNGKIRKIEYSFSK